VARDAPLKRGIEVKQSTNRPSLRRAIVVVGILFLALGSLPARSLAYDIHKDRLDCPKGTTLARIEINPRVCRAQPKRGIPSTRGRRACCTFDRDPSKERCLPFPGCPAASVE
jgi:hypothetical protein